MNRKINLFWRRNLHTPFHGCRYASECLYKYIRRTSLKSILFPYQLIRDLILQPSFQHWYHLHSHINILKALLDKSQSLLYKMMLTILIDYYLVVYKSIRICHRCHPSFFALHLMVVRWMSTSYQMNTIYGKSI